MLIDAEQSYFQHAIEHLVLYYMMKKFNHTHPVIYNTVQAYLIVSIYHLVLIASLSQTLSLSYLYSEGTRMSSAAFDGYSANGITMWDKTGM